MRYDKTLKHIPSKEKLVLLFWVRGIEGCGTVLWWRGQLYCLIRGKKITSQMVGGTEVNTKLPNRALFNRIKFTFSRAIPVCSKFRSIAERSINPESCRGVSPCQDTQFESLWAVFAAPHISSRNPEKLLWWVREGWQLLLLSEYLCPL